MNFYRYKQDMKNRGWKVCIYFCTGAHMLFTLLCVAIISRVESRGTVGIRNRTEISDL